MSGSSQKFTLRDLAVLAFAMCVIGPATIVHTQRAREQSNRVKCASNLRQIGQAIMIYANENKNGPFPRTVYDPVADPVPTEYTGVNAANPFAMPGGPGPNDVSSGLYLLLRGGDITQELFICPSSTTADTFDPPTALTVNARSNFASRATLSYAYANPYPSATARGLGFKMNYTLSSDFAIAADMGPGPAAAQVPANAPRPRMIAANTPNHAGDGQNVLYADGHVDWSATPFAGSPRPVTGAPRDNIYAFGADNSPATPSAGVRGAAQDQYDSVILPSFDMGQQPGPIPAPGSRSAGISLFPNFGSGNTGVAAGGGTLSGAAVVVLAGVILLILTGGGVLLFLLLRASRPGRYPPPPGLA